MACTSPFRHPHLLGLPCDLSAPCTVDVAAVVEQLQCAYLQSVRDSTPTKMQQYLRMGVALDRDTYSRAAYLQAVGGWRQRKHLAQLRTGSHWLAVDTRRFGPRAVIRQERLCERCGAHAVDDEEHMLFDCAALEQQRRQHSSLFVRNEMPLADFMGQDPTELAAFVYDCYQACEE